MIKKFSEIIKWAWHSRLKRHHKIRQKVSEQVGDFV